MRLDMTGPRSAPAYVAALLTACGSALQAPSPAAPVLVEPLSPREQELLWLRAAGLSTPEVAAQLFITTGTVRDHRKSIYGKLAVHRRVQAAERARALGLVLAPAPRGFRRSVAALRSATGRLSSCRRKCPTRLSQMGQDAPPPAS